ncbi:MAG: SpoIIE family protein phosphatase [Pseudomonadota bacterium]
MSTGASMRCAMRTLSRNPGEPCGDVVAAWHRDGAIFLCVVDGLGHGPDAHAAAAVAAGYVAEHLGEELARVFEGCDRALQHTRGVAMGLAVIRNERLTYGGIGNTRVMRVGRRDKRFMSDPGILGTGFRHLMLDSTGLEPGDLVLLFTDGLNERARIPRPKGAGGADLEAIADRFIEEWRRGRDDAGVLVYEHGGIE